ncbi:hypothetical protein BDV39DRAFT_189829 [Aspergillus sergii]|uniref:Cyclase-domain-containing protein n=1 Tax=Aspergillus sergii TaxID=1034303 RepID=A0A5N6XGC7_9EURO|nr:hypothetical protein BDV39DRAFT_189829 [Aspergillus sergii]
MFPQFKELPIQPGAPPGSAWGVFDKDGKRDIYGTLNFITPEAVITAREEIKTGESAVLNLPLHLPYHPDRIGRTKFHHRLIADMFEMTACDDEVTVNTQATSQWDGLMHYADPERRTYYNGVSYDDAALRRTDRSLCIDTWSQRGGIVARGVLIDYVRYAAKKEIVYNPLGPHAISLEEIEEIVAEEDLEIRPGDVLLVRCGLSKYIRESLPDDITPFDAAYTQVGVDPSPEFLEWLWNHNIAAVAGDALAFEAIPATDGTHQRLHKTCLSGWGMPIGELFDLEALARIAEKNQRWSFFLTVSPLNIQGGANTLSNTVAVF